ncbi:MAG: ricin-type beta-trefoil lectin domain protein [Thalassotalea sp.]
MIKTKLKQKLKVLGVVSLCLTTSNMVNAAPYFQTGENPIAAGKMWSPVANMSDEFDGNSLDTQKWQDEPVANGWTWIGRAPGLFDASAVNVNSGKLRVTVSKLPSPQTVNGNEFLYKGAIVRSINAGQHGWYYETKMKANNTEMSSTFWLMSKNSNCETKHELDIQENVGVISPTADAWAANFDHIFHSNMIHRTTNCNPTPTQIQGSVLLNNEKNSDRYFVYGAWWKSPTEVRFYLDGKYVYSITPSTPFNVDMWLQMAIETYDWNPVPATGSKVENGTWEERTTQYEWIRTWKIEDAPTTTNSVFIKKRNATGYAIDGGNGATNGQNVYLWNANVNNLNQNWNEISRGNGYYSYQKANTNFCLGGGNGGSNGQSVKLWPCGDTVQNQHWKKIHVSGNHYRLEKRNASGYSIDGGGGGANLQDVKLWASDHNNQNQHWTFTQGIQ